MELEEFLLEELFIELEEDSDLWDEMVEEWSDLPQEGPTPAQRAAFEERLQVEVKRIQNEKRQLSQTHTTHSNKPHTITRITTHRTFRKIGTVAAVLAVIILAGFCFPDSAIASGFNRIMATVLPEQGAEELRLEEKNGVDEEFDPKDFEGMYVPGWVPKGFQIVGIMNSREEKAIYYQNDAKDDICFHVSEGTSSFMVDDEDVEEETILIHGEQGKKIVTESLVYIVWEKGNYLYSVSGQIKFLSELSKMAERCIVVEGR